MVMPCMNLEVVVAIPAYNEEKRIESVVRRCRESGAEVWVMDDGSNDRTGEVSKSAGAAVIRHERNQGKGMAIRTALDAFAKSDRRFLIFMDADGQHDPAMISAFVEHARANGSQVLLGNRMLSTAKMPTVRRWTNQFMSWLISLLARQKIPDTQCGYRLLGRDFVLKFRPTTDRFDLESEMIIQAGRLGFKIESIVIPTIYDGQGSHIHPVWDTLRFMKLVLRYL